MKGFLKNINFDCGKVMFQRIVWFISLDIHVVIVNILRSYENLVGNYLNKYEIQILQIQYISLFFEGHKEKFKNSKQVILKKK